MCEFMFCLNAAQFACIINQLGSCDDGAMPVLFAKNRAFHRFSSRKNARDRFVQAWFLRQSLTSAEALRRRPEAGQPGVRRAIMFTALSVITPSSAWLKTSMNDVTAPRSGFDREGVALSTVTRTDSVSPGRTGLSQRSSSTPGEAGV